MQIEIHLPRSTEAKVQVDEKKGIIVIEPLFPTAQAVQPYAYARVVGRKGKERRYAMCAAGKNGRLINQEVKDVDTEFDGATADAEDSPE